MSFMGFLHKETALGTKNLQMSKNFIIFAVNYNFIFMLRRFITTLFTLFGVGLSVFAEGVLINGIHYLLNGNTATVTYTYNNSDFPHNNTYTGDIIIPDSVTHQGHTYRVTGIAAYAFTSTSITSVAIPASMKRIVCNAFSATPQLTRIEWNGRSTACVDDYFNTPKSLTAPALHEFVVGEDVDTLQESLLANSSVKIIRFNARNCSRAYRVFGQDHSVADMGTHIDSVFFGNTVEAIPALLFQDVNYIQYFELGQNIRTIGYLAFYIYNYNDSCFPDTLRLPPSIERIEEHGMPPYKSVLYIPKSLRYCIPWKDSGAQYHIEDLGAWAWMEKPYFYDNLSQNDLYSADTLITYLDLPDTLTRVKHHSFCKARSIQGFHLPDSLRVIEKQAFMNVPGPSALVMPEKMDSIYEDGLHGCNIPDIYLTQSTPFYLGKHAMYNYVGYISSKDRTPNVYMACNGDYASFSNHSEWKKYALKNFSPFYKVQYNKAYFGDIQVTALEPTVSYDCDTQESTVYAYSPYKGWCFSHWSDGVTDSVRQLSLTRDTTFEAHFVRCQGDEIGVADSIVYTAQSELNCNARYYSNGFHSGKFSVLLVDHTFSGDTGKLYFCDPVTELSDSAFVCAYYITSLTLPESVQSIGTAFLYCNSKLASLTSKAIVPPVCQDNSFQVIKYQIPLYVPDASVDAYRQAPVWCNFTNILPLSDLLSTDIQNTEANRDTRSVRKILRDNQILILRNGKTYTVQGQEMNLH